MIFKVFATLIALTNFVQYSCTSGSINNFQSIDRIKYSDIERSNTFGGVDYEYESTSREAYSLSFMTSEYELSEIYSTHDTNSPTNTAYYSYKYDIYALPTASDYYPSIARIAYFEYWVDTTYPTSENLYLAYRIGRYNTYITTDINFNLKLYYRIYLATSSQNPTSMKTIENVINFAIVDDWGTTHTIDLGSGFKYFNISNMVTRNWFTLSSISADEYNNNVNTEAIYNDGFTHGYDDGYNDGNTFGYNTGYTAGINATNNYTFINFFGAIADTPILYLRNLLGFQIFGVSAMNVLMSMITACLVLYLLRKVIF